MTDPEKPAEHLTEEPQGERGEPGARDEGFAPGEGPADRPEGQTGGDTTIDEQDTAQPDMPHAPTGDGG
jgi:hypothetical protein